MLLGTLRVKIEARVHVGDHTVILGWCQRKEGRKVFVASALFSEKGKPLAKAEGVWILTPSKALP
jgi:hypothetical protein